MDRLKTFGIYALMIIGMYLFTQFLIFVFFNINYKDITTNGILPQQITIDKAEAKSEEGRIYGYVQNKSDNDLNGKYMKVEILNSANEVINTQHIKISDLKEDEKKMFKVFFQVKDAKYYNINIVDTENG